MKIKNIIYLPLLLTTVIVAVFFIDVFLPGSFNSFGIRPRNISGLPGVLLSPFLHGNVKHLASNAIPILVMGSFVSALAPSLFIYRTTVLIILSGLLTWVLSSPGIVIGASGLVFAYWSYLIVNGFIKKRAKDILFAVVTLVIYGALILSLFEYQRGVSWAGHFSGAIAGALFALTQTRRSR